MKKVVCDLSKRLSTTSSSRKGNKQEKVKTPTTPTTPVTPNNASSKKKTKKTSQGRTKCSPTAANFEMDIPDDAVRQGWATTYEWSEEGLRNADAFMKQYSDMGEAAIKAEFKKDVEGYKSPTYADTAFHANPTKNADKEKVTCLDDSRVILNGNKYINASWAYDTQKRFKSKYIITQPALPTTLEDFWTMVYEQKVEVVFVLCQMVKEGEGKPADALSSIQMWPAENEQTMDIGKISLRNTKWSSAKDWRGMELEVKKKESEKVHKLRILHITGWEPTYTQATAKKLQRIFRDMALAEGECYDIRPGPLVVMDDHCGIGIASVLIVADVVGSLLFNGEKNVKLPSVVQWARCCRNGAIRSADDYFMVVRTIAETIHFMRKIRKGQATEGDWEKQTAEYEKICGKTPVTPKRRQ